MQTLGNRSHTLFGRENGLLNKGITQPVPRKPLRQVILTPLPPRDVCHGTGYTITEPDSSGTRTIYIRSDNQAEMAQILQAFQQEVILDLSTKSGACSTKALSPVKPVISDKAASPVIPSPSSSPFEPVIPTKVLSPAQLAIYTNSLHYNTPSILSNTLTPAKPATSTNTLSPVPTKTVSCNKSAKRPNTSTPVEPVFSTRRLSPSDACLSTSDACFSPSDACFSPARPSITYIQMIGEALLDAPLGRLATSEICTYITRKYRGLTRTWKYNVRNILSNAVYFQKEQTLQKGSHFERCLWSITPRYLDDFRIGKFSTITSDIYYYRKKQLLEKTGLVMEENVSDPSQVTENRNQVASLPHAPITACPMEIDTSQYWLRLPYYFIRNPNTHYFPTTQFGKTCNTQEQQVDPGANINSEDNLCDPAGGSSGHSLNDKNQSHQENPQSDRNENGRKDIPAAYNDIQNACNVSNGVNYAYNQKFYCKENERGISKQYCAPRNTLSDKVTTDTKRKLFTDVKQADDSVHTAIGGLGNTCYKRASPYNASNGFTVSERNDNQQAAHHDQTSDALLKKVDNPSVTDWPHCNLTPSNSIYSQAEAVQSQKLGNHVSTSRAPLSELKHVNQSHDNVLPRVNQNADLAKCPPRPISCNEGTAKEGLPQTSIPYTLPVLPLYRYSNVSSLNNTYINPWTAMYIYSANRYHAG